MPPISVTVEPSQTIEVTLEAGIAQGVTDHSLLTNLDYASSGHTGFASTSSLANYVPYTGATGNVYLGTNQLRFSSSSNANTAIYAEYIPANPPFIPNDYEWTKISGNNTSIHELIMQYFNGGIKLQNNTSVTGTLSATGNITGANLSGTNTGDQDLSGYVPYTGATTNVNLGTYNIEASKLIVGGTTNDIGFKVNPSNAGQVNLMNSADSLGVLNAEDIQTLGGDFWAYSRNPLPGNFTEGDTLISMNTHVAGKYSGLTHWYYDSTWSTVGEYRRYAYNNLIFPEAGRIQIRGQSGNVDTPTATRIFLLRDFADGIHMHNNVGIGTQFSYFNYNVANMPTAWLHLGLGSTSKAPLRFTSGPLRTTPETGTIEYLDGTFYLQSDNLNVTGNITSDGNITSNNIFALEGDNSLGIYPTSIQALTQIYQGNWVSKRLFFKNVNDIDFENNDNTYGGDIWFKPKAGMGVKILGNLTTYYDEDVGGGDIIAGKDITATGNITGSDVISLSEFYAKDSLSQVSATFYSTFTPGFPTSTYASYIKGDSARANHTLNIETFGGGININNNVDLGVNEIGASSFNVANTDGDNYSWIYGDEDDLWIENGTGKIYIGYAYNGTDPEGVRDIIVNQRLSSQVTTGRSPLIIQSTTVNTNLNADLLDGYHASSFVATSGTSDIEITDNTKGIILKSPDGTRYRIQVADDGSITTEAVV